MYVNVDEGSFLKLMGFNRRSFVFLMKILFLYPVRREFGWPRLLDDKDMQGLYLLYL